MENTKRNFRGEPYITTNQKELRTMFWQLCDELGVDYAGKKHTFDLNLNMMFNDWTDNLRKDHLISEKLYNNATLY